MSRYSDYTFKYANRQAPLEPDETCKIVQFQTLPGRSRHLSEKAGPIDPTPGYDSHSSQNHLEWYLFHEDQLLPAYVLTVRAIVDGRTDADDGLREPRKNDHISHSNKTPKTATPSRGQKRSADSASPEEYQSGKKPKPGPPSPGPTGKRAPDGDHDTPQKKKKKKAGEKEEASQDNKSEASEPKRPRDPESEPVQPTAKHTGTVAVRCRGKGKGAYY